MERRAEEKEFTSPEAVIKNTGSGQKFLESREAQISRH